MLLHRVVRGHVSCSLFIQLSSHHYCEDNCSLALTFLENCSDRRGRYIKVIYYEFSTHRRRRGSDCERSSDVPAFITPLYMHVARRSRSVVLCMRMILFADERNGLCKGATYMNLNRCFFVGPLYSRDIYFLCKYR